MPNIMRAPSSTAVEDEPGIPRVSNGTRAPETEALLAASGAAKPSTDPLPNSSGCWLTRLSVAQASRVATAPPAPGMRPTKKQNKTGRAPGREKEWQKG